MFDACKCVHGPALRSLGGVGFFLVDSDAFIKIIACDVADPVDSANLLRKMSVPRSVRRSFLLR